MKRRSGPDLADAMHFAALRCVPRHATATFDLILWWRCRHRGAFPSQDWLGKRLGLCERTVRRHVALLEAAGVLDVTRHRPHHDPATGHWRRRTNRYRCRFPPRSESKNRNSPAPRGRPPSPTGHECPQSGFTQRSGGPPTPAAGVPGQVVAMNDAERRTCVTCGGTTPPGRWRCDECQTKVDQRTDGARQAAAIAAALRAGRATPNEDV